MTEKKQLHVVGVLQTSPEKDAKILKQKPGLFVSVMQKPEFGFPDFFIEISEVDAVGRVIKHQHIERHSRQELQTILENVGSNIVELINDQPAVYISVTRGFEEKLGEAIYNETKIIDMLDVEFVLDHDTWDLIVSEMEAVSFPVP